MNTRSLWAVPLALSLAGAAPAQTPAPVIHRYAAGASGMFVNAYLVETPHGVVAIDATLTESDSKALRAQLDSLGKPLLAVLITHGHPGDQEGRTTIRIGACRDGAGPGGVPGPRARPSSGTSFATGCTRTWRTGTPPAGSRTSSASATRWPRTWRCTRATAILADPTCWRGSRRISRRIARPWPCWRAAARPSIPRPRFSS